MQDSFSGNFSKDNIMKNQAVFSIQVLHYSPQNFHQPTNHLNLGSQYATWNQFSYIVTNCEGKYSSPSAFLYLLNEFLREGKQRSVSGMEVGDF